MELLQLVINKLLMNSPADLIQQDGNICNNPLAWSERLAVLAKFCVFNRMLQVTNLVFDRLNVHFLIYIFGAFMKLTV